MPAGQQNHGFVTGQFDAESIAVHHGPPDITTGDRHHVSRIGCAQRDGRFFGRPKGPNPQKWS
jgi:hypothetical protein